MWNGGGNACDPSAPAQVAKPTAPENPVTAHYSGLLATAVPIGNWATALVGPQPCLSSCSCTYDSGACLLWWPSETLRPQKGIGAHNPGHGGGTCHPSAPSGDASYSSTSRSKAPATPEAHSKTRRELATHLAVAVEGGKCRFSNIARGSAGKWNQKFVL